MMIATLTERLKSPAPSSFKALILLQALPVASLVPLIEDIEKLAKTEDNGYIAAIGGSMLQAAKAEKAKAEEADAKLKWELWSGQYGHSRASWLPPPDPLWPEWGWYGMRWVGQDEWWIPRPEEKEEDKAE